MKNENYEKEVIQYFERLSMPIRKIPESSEKTPDFLIESDERVLIELKAKFDLKELHLKQKDTLDTGKVFQHGELTGYTGKVAKIISEGNSQLKKQKDATNSQFCFLFLIASGVTASSQVKQFISTFYGCMPIVDFDSKSSQAKNCYYFTESQFFRFKDSLDGAFIVNLYTGEVQFVLNDKSTNYSSLKQSKFLEKCRRHIPVIDPIELEAQGHVYIADCELNRRNMQDVQKYVFEKYGIKKGMCHNFENTVFQASL
ncbi:hypothetical protein [Vibrio splendidus]|uniref:hypothetical protein n=1 Tax=Vibrio splendidus TaxID=29497 RepID=UPI00106FCD1A|nr:hypothetical protein [Vibrio splendidus]